MGQTFPVRWKQWRHIWNRQTSLAAVGIRIVLETLRRLSRWMKANWIISHCLGSWKRSDSMEWLAFKVGVKEATPTVSCAALSKHSVTWNGVSKHIRAGQIWNCFRKILISPKSARVIRFLPMKWGGAESQKFGNSPLNVIFYERFGAKVVDSLLISLEERRISWNGSFLFSILQKSSSTALLP